MLTARVATATTALRAARARQAAGARRRREIAADRGRAVRWEETELAGRGQADRGPVGIVAAETVRRAGVRRRATMNRARCARPHLRS